MGDSIFNIHAEFEYVNNFAGMGQESLAVQFWRLEFPVPKGVLPFPEGL
jgi:hypothetical protein